jgi:hypothetical protein
MSRLPRSPETPSCLPRRALLKALAAAPTAVALAPGQVFSSPIADRLHSVEDERFETFRRLILEEERWTDVEFGLSFGDPRTEAVQAASLASWEAVKSFMRDVWSKPVAKPADLLLRARFMEYAELRHNSDNDVYYAYADPARNLVAGQLEFLAANPSFGPLVRNVKDGPRYLGVTMDELQTSIAADSRFAKFDDLVRRIVDLDVRQEAAFGEYDPATISSCTEDPEVDNGVSPWCVLHDRLVREMSDFAKAESHKPYGALDLLLQLKIANYYFAVGDVGFMETNDMCQTAVANAISFFGLTPQVHIDELRVPAPEPERSTELTPRQQRQQSVMDWRSKIRTADKRLRKALVRESSLEDGLPAHSKAMTATARRLADLDRLTDKFLPIVDDFPMADGYQLQCELLAAHRPDFIELPSGDRSGKILRHLLQYARQHGDWMIEDAAYRTQIA